LAQVSITRYHDISCGHRVVGHEGKCKGLHGHNHRIHFTCSAPDLDPLGRVIDFGAVKQRLCQWLEDNWDHKMLLWSEDPALYVFSGAHMTAAFVDAAVIDEVRQSIEIVDFNPTAENMALYLLRVLGPERLIGTGVTLVRVHIEETRKCSATVELTPEDL
jgi:6-pyruvoyltetrahydropterin/6-carboxytetrahydropterin synthase